VLIVEVSPGACTARQASTRVSYHRMCGRCTVLSTCPICNRPLKPDLTDRPLYGILRHGDGAVENLRAYSCGPKGHLIVLSENGNGSARSADAQHGNGTNGAESRRILNGWKEIAAYIDRGVRTVQRWESLGLPVRRPKGSDRSAVLAFSDEIDMWLRQAPVRFLAGNSLGTPAPKMPPETKRSGPAITKGSERRSIVHGLSAASEPLPSVS
jgi:hypothetical protein